MALFVLDKVQIKTPRGFKQFILSANAKTTN